MAIIGKIFTEVSYMLFVGKNFVGIIISAADTSWTLPLMTA